MDHNNMNINYPTTTITTTTTTTTTTNSFIAALIPTATDSSLPLGSVPLVTSTLALIAGKSRLIAMIHYICATLIQSLPSLF